jgi:hypothetical protein
LNGALTDELEASARRFIEQYIPLIRSGGPIPGRQTGRPIAHEKLKNTVQMSKDLPDGWSFFAL